MLYDSQAVTVGGAAVSTISSHVMLGAGSGFAVGAGSTLNVTGALANSVWATGGNGSFIKTGAGTLALSGASTYTGNTTVTGGTLSLGQVNSNNESSTVSIAAAAGAKLNLAFSGTDTVGMLFINGVQQPAGNYTSAHASGAFTGGGTLHVTWGAYETWANGTFVPALTAKLAGDNQDGDSLTNLQEYAFGTQPTVATGDIVVSGATVTPGVPKMISDNGSYYMVFGRRKDYVAAGLTYTVQFTAGLNLWGDNDDIANPPESMNATDGTIDAIRVPFPSTIHVANGDPKPNFARVRVVGP